MNDLITLNMTDMANGGAALGRDDKQRVVFVPLTIPGEEVKVSITEDKPRFARGRLVELLQPAPERVEARCPHFGPCGGCHFQHIDYPAQLRFKEDVIRDQFKRIGGLDDLPMLPIWANPQPWAYANTITFSPTATGSLGFWSPESGQVMPIATCLLLRPAVLDLYQDLDLDLPGLRSLTLRVGLDDELLAVLTTDDFEPPALEADFPVSAAILLPDDTAVNLIGENFLLQSVAGRLFRVSAGCYFPVSLAATEFLIETVLSLVSPGDDETILEVYSGVGTLTAFLAARAAALTAIEANPDAVADAAVNLEDTDNITLYQGLAEEILPILDITPEVIVVDPPPEGLPPGILDQIVARRPARLVYVSSDIATLSRDARRLLVQGYRLAQLQPLDMQPQTYLVQTVSLWVPG